ncbi:hypothetical protein TVAG_021070 [Trichomonas vaginalis G3]|uniref:Uncharacterized protein n=1 Tax=Trichomonas vaginalis (strain ATCC PRA-98 / G3) TaxID=412133 RepID=A2DH89_TRIV3|nr:armadillo (ARM) repeat-containing protein family [Trichomonas vaginalis G3]EAY20162.1 hypothetical protein TVAG_021070 [Trichomonas vaginalis G3]KAI5507643.1 armadillo (ARM) repeat-containing protein family [Trichomonas vaginalis G3]|eukprot:XP_001581148.1 hypothetical protein [Trichomonas vaginalis G3]
MDDYKFEENQKKNHVQNDMERDDKLDYDILQLEKCISAINDISISDVVDEKQLDSQYSVILQILSQNASLIINQNVEDPLISFIIHNIQSAFVNIVQGASALLRACAKGTNCNSLIFIQDENLNVIISFLKEGNDCFAMSNIFSVIIEILKDKDTSETIIQQLNLEILTEILNNTINKIIIIGSDPNRNVLMLRMLVFLNELIYITKNYKLADLINQFLTTHIKLIDTIADPTIIKFICCIYLNILSYVQFDKELISIFFKWMDINSPDVLNLIINIICNNKYPGVPPSDFILKRMIGCKDPQLFNALCDAEVALCERNQRHLEIILKDSNEFISALITMVDENPYSLGIEIARFLAYLVYQQINPEFILSSGVLGVISSFIDSNSADSVEFVASLFNLFKTPSMTHQIYKFLNENSIIEEIESCADRDFQDLADISSEFLDEIEKYQNSEDSNERS